MLNAAGIILVGSSLLWQQLEGQSIVLFVFAIAGAEVSVGLALIGALLLGRRSKKVPTAETSEGEL